MSKILLTGGAGYIGSHTAINFIENGNDIIIFDNFSSSNELVIKKLKVITKADIRFIKGDLRNLKDLQLLFEKNSFDSVVHFAGLKSPSDSLLNPIEYFNNNIIGSINLISVMSDFEVKKIIFSSSASVYGYSDTQPLKEKSSINPINPYSKSKQIVEELLMSLGSEWRIVILRYFNPAGAHSSGLIGEDPQGVPNNLMPYIQKVATGELEKVFIFGNDYNTRDGTGIRVYIHVMDLAECHLSALNFMKSNPGFHTFNLGTGKNVSVLELIDAYEKVTQKKIPYEFSSRRHGDVGACWADVSLANKMLKWKAIRDIHDMCKDSWNWSKNRVV